MKVAGMMRLAEIDQTKVSKRLMKLAIQSLADTVSHLYFLQIGEIDNDIIDFINSAVAIKIKGEILKVNTFTNADIRSKKLMSGK